jgi:hypothetical protein
MAAVTSMTENEAAAWTAGRGIKVTRHHGHAWQQVHPGFYQPVHLLGRVGQASATRPARACWGYRAVVTPDTPVDRWLAAYLLDDLAGYDERTLSRSRRASLRKAWRAARFDVLSADTPLRQHGYGVLCSALARTGHRQVPTHERYQATIAALGIGRSCTAVTASIDDRLVGYITCHVIEGTAYGEDFFVATEALAANVPTGLVFEILQHLRRSGVVQQISNGLVADEHHGLDSFKTSMGFSRTMLPTKVHITPIAARVLARWTPARYGRLAGRTAAP